MKHIALSLLAAAGLAVTSARADHVAVGGSITFGSPGYYAPAPGYYAPAYSAPVDGYWRDVPVNVWVPGHWESGRDYMGNYVNRWEPGHYVVRSQRVWVSGYEARREHEHWEHERWEHERRERGDWDHDGWRR